MNMKKVIVLITAFSFLVSILGINVTIGYCPMKKNYSFSFIKKAYSCCCTKSNKKKCCNSEKVVLKKITDDYLSSVVKSVPSETNYTIIQFTAFPKRLIIENTYSIKDSYKPPVATVPLVILNRSILI